MRLLLRDVLYRAAQRGYTLEEIRPCLISDLGDGYFEVDTESPHYPRTLKQGYKPSAGLGDIVKSLLSGMGITEDRVSRVIGRPCGCGQRAAALNAAGAKYLGLPPGLPPENTG